MKYLLLYYAFLSPVLVFAQKETATSDMVYNVYRKDVQAIVKYNKEYLGTLKNKSDIIHSKDSVYTTVKLLLNKNCIDKVALFVDIVTEAKENRTRISFNNPRYVYEGDKCPKEGTLEELVNCDKCKMGTSLILEEYKDYRKDIFIMYHRFLKDKRHDKDNW
jgi:hypothetical protein